MKPLTYEEFCQQPLNYTAGYTTDRMALRIYRNNELGIQQEVVTRRKATGDIYSGWLVGKDYWYLDGDDEEYVNAACLYEAWMRKVTGEKT